MKNYVILLLIIVLFSNCRNKKNDISFQGNEQNQTENLSEDSNNETLIENEKNSTLGLPETETYNPNEKEEKIFINQKKKVDEVLQELDRSIQKRNKENANTVVSHIKDSQYYTELEQVLFKVGEFANSVDKSEEDYDEILRLVFVAEEMIENIADATDDPLTDNHVLPIGLFFELGEYKISQAGMDAIKNYSETIYLSLDNANEYSVLIKLEEYADDIDIGTNLINSLRKYYNIDCSEFNNDKACHNYYLSVQRAENVEDQIQIHLHKYQNTISELEFFNSEKGEQIPMNSKCKEDCPDKRCMMTSATSIKRLERQK